MRRHRDVGLRQVHHYYFRNGTMDFATGWILGYGQLGGLSAGEVFDCLNQIRDGDPRSWVNAFSACADRQEAAGERQAAIDPAGAAERYLASAVAARAAWHLIDPTGSTATALLDQLERAFQRSMALSGSHLCPTTIRVDTLPGATLPAYQSRPGTLGDDGRPWYVVIGGGDTFREDLYFFGGREALRRGYRVLLVDLPGQGSTPYQGLHFGTATATALRQVLAGLRSAWPDSPIVLTGYSGGGYFTAVAAADRTLGLSAWVASTPVTDISALLASGMPAVAQHRRAAAWTRPLVRLAGRVNPVLDAALRKYAWQFGSDSLADLVTLAGAAGVVDPAAIDVPVLGLVGLSEAAEARRQAAAVVADVRRRHPESELVEFEPWTGADAHCQVNNLPLAQRHIFGWLSRLGLAPPGAGTPVASSSSNARSDGPENSLVRPGMIDGCC
jgi:alpha-beta hydrolase superfamily lysophospholipase